MANSLAYRLVENWRNSDIFKRYFVIATKCKGEMVTRDKDGEALPSSRINDVPGINHLPPIDVGFDEMYGEEFEPWKT